MLNYPLGYFSGGRVYVMDWNKSSECVHISVIIVFYPAFCQVCLYDPRIASVTTMGKMWTDISRNLMEKKEGNNKTERKSNYPPTIQMLSCLTLTALMCHKIGARTPCPWADSSQCVQHVKEQEEELFVILL